MSKTDYNCDDCTNTNVCIIYQKIKKIISKNVLTNECNRREFMMEIKTIGNVCENYRVDVCNDN